MGRFLIKDEDSKIIKKAIKKFSEKEISSSNAKLRGTFKITNYRNYLSICEVDVEFTGEINAKTQITNSEWHSSKIYKQKGFSKIKINRLIKYYLFYEVKQHAAYFGIEIKYIENIKKIKWV